MRYRLGGLVAAMAMAAATPSAYAAPADLDPSFDTDGVAMMPADGRISAQGRPIVQSDGKVLVAGLVGSTQKVVVQRFTATGAPDTTFGSGGELTTDLVAPFGRVAVADAGGGAFHVAAGSQVSGKVTLERFAADGTLAAKVAVKVPGTLSWPTAAVARSDGSTYVASEFDCGKGVHCFGILKFKGAGLDAAFGGSGYQKTKVGSYSRPLDVTVVPAADGTERIVVAGSLGTPGTAASDTAIVRYRSDGTLDPTFDGDGIKTVDLSGTGRADHANAVVAEASGAFTLAGGADTSGYVARFTSTGAPDASFGTGGIVRGGFAATQIHTASDLARDGSARYVVSGTATDPATGTTRWTVSRLSTAGAFDASFTAGGTSLLGPCANTSGFGTVGVAISSTNRIHLSGNCTSNRPAVARLVSAPPFTGPATLSVAPVAEAAGHERVTNAQVDPTTVLGAVETLVSSPLHTGPLHTGPLHTGPLHTGPLHTGPLHTGPLLKPAIASQILLSGLPLVEGTWTERLRPFYPGGDVPPEQTITLADANAVAPSVIAGLTYGDVDFDRTPLRGASLAAVLLTRPIQFLPAPGGGWCAFLAPMPLNCSNGVSTASTTLFDLEYAGDDLGAYYATPLPLGPPTDLGTGTSRALLSYVELRLVDLADTPFAAVPASQVAALLACNPDCAGTLAERQAADPEGFTSATLGELIARLPLPALPNVTLGQILTGLVNEDEIPYERASRARLLAAADLRSADLQTYTVGVGVDCTQSAGLEVVPALPDDARLVPGSAAAAVGTQAVALADAAGGAYSLAPACAGRSGPTNIDVTFRVEPGSQLGPRTASVTVRSSFGSRQASVPVTVDDSRDPGDAFTDTQALGTDKLVQGWISSSRDVDSYAFPAPPVGTRVTITLSHLPADYDVRVYGPQSSVESGPLHTGPLHTGPLHTGPLHTGPVPDSSQDPTATTVVEPDTVHDIPLHTGPLHTGSINRGTTDEAVTFLVRSSDAGGTFTVQVSGFGGAFEGRSYTLRRRDAEPPPPPPCPARTGLNSGAPGAWPSSIPDSTRAIYLVNRQRLAAIDGDAAATGVMTRLSALAEATDGVLLPVESHPTLPAGPLYADWDASPCSPAAAIAVGKRIGAILEDVRAEAGGLPQLRSLVLVGPDTVIPQIRVRDEAVISNEREYADELVFRGVDDAISGALREGYLLSDDPYGDFDASPPLYVPDVALGRLVETAREISAQLDRYAATNGVIDPTDAFVSGYDFLTDGALEQAAALRSSAANTHIGDNWNAATALAGINRSTTGYTAVNAHYDHYRGLPEAAFDGSGAPDLLHARDAQPQPGSMLFTMGCHSGLNVSAALASPTADEALRLGDWAQLLGRHNSLWAASTGFSYGDDTAVAYTERIMADFAANLATEDVTVGQALMYAKQSGAGALGVLDAYYVKASLGATFYGLPMTRFTADPADGTGASGMPPRDANPDSGATTRSSDPLSVDFDLQRVSTDRGDYWHAAGQDPLVVQHRPVQPKVTADVTKAGRPATGFLVEELTTREVTGVNPVIARPTVDLAAHEPEPDVRDAFFPSALASVSTTATPEGRRDRLVLTAGQFRGDRQRLFTHIGGRVLRSTSTAGERLTIRRVDGIVAGSSFSVRVDVDGAGAIGGNLIYVTDADLGAATVSWRRSDLSVVAPGVLSTGGPLTAGATHIVEAYVQVVNAQHEVFTSTRKVEGYSFAPFATPGAGDPRVTFTPAVPPSGYYTAPPTVTLDPGEHAGARFEFSVDGGEFKPYTPGTPLPDSAPVDGQHVVRFRGSDGSAAVARWAVDTAGPTAVAEADRPPNAEGWYSAPVTISFRCADAVSGVQACPDPVTLSGEGADQSATGTATDRAGNSASTTVSGIDIDLTTPVIEGSVRGTKNRRGWYLDAPTVSFSCSDALSGVASCPGDRTPGEGEDQSVTGEASDRAGHRASDTVDDLDVDLAAPSVAITSSEILLVLSPLRGTVSDTATGSGVESVTVTWTSGSTTVTEEARRDCDGKRCSWSADLPGLGIWTAVATATERSGRVASSPEKTFTITVG